MKIIVIADPQKLSAASYYSSIILLLKKIAGDHSLEIIEAENIKAVPKKLPQNFLLFISNTERKNAVFRSVTDFQLTHFINRIGYNVLISADSFLYKFFKKTKLFVLEDVSILNNKKKSAKFLSRNNGFITYTEAIKKTVRELSQQNNKAEVVYPSSENFYKEISSEEKINIKSKYTDGKEFFITPLPKDEANFITVLKTFSAFKKWQQSNMKLVFCNFFPTEISFSKEKTDSYKYKNDVVFFDVLNENSFAEILASAYAFISFSKDEEDVPLAAKALQSCIPVIAQHNENMQEICAAAALFAADEPSQSIAKLMIELYKNETLRSKMITFAKQQALLFDLEKNAAQLWQLINSAASGIDS